MMIKNSLIKIKEHSPHQSGVEGKDLPNSMALASLDPESGQCSFRSKLDTSVPVNASNVQAVCNIFYANAPEISLLGVGVDQVM